MTVNQTLKSHFCKTHPICFSCLSTFHVYSTPRIIQAPPLPFYLVSSLNNISQSVNMYIFIHLFTGFFSSSSNVFFFTFNILLPRPSICYSPNIRNHDSHPFKVPIIFTFSCQSMTFCTNTVPAPTFSQPSMLKLFPSTP